MTDYFNQFSEQLEIMEACNISILISDSMKNYISNKEYKLEVGMKNYIEVTLFLMTAGGNTSLIRKELNNTTSDEMITILRMSPPHEHTL